MLTHPQIWTHLYLKAVKQRIVSNATEIDFALAVLIACLIGRLARAGQDIRMVGSCGTGARSVGPLLGRLAAFATMLGDAAKAAIAVALSICGECSFEVISLVALSVAIIYLYRGSARRELRAAVMT